MLAGTQAILSAAHYNVNLGLTRVAASRAGAHMVDLGGHTGVVREQHALDDDARRAGITVVPDTGMGPGPQRVARRLRDEPAGPPAGGGHLGRRPAAGTRARRGTTCRRSR